MPFLVADVTLDLLAQARADGKCAVAFLPLEATEPKLRVHPLGGFAFEHAHEVSHAMRRLQTDEAMNMVGHTANGDRHSIQRFDATAEPLVESGPPRDIDKVAPILCGPDDVVMETGVGRGHGVHAPLLGR